MRNILRPKQISIRLSLSLATIWRLIKRDDFPRKIQLSEKAVGFFEDEVVAWAEKRRKT